MSATRHVGFINGGSGNDTFVVKPGFGNDRFEGFDANPNNGQDRLDIRDLGISGDNLAGRVVTSDLGSDTLVTIDGQTIRFVRSRSRRTISS